MVIRMEQLLQQGQLHQEARVNNRVEHRETGRKRAHNKREIIKLEANNNNLNRQKPDSTRHKRLLVEDKATRSDQLRILKVAHSKMEPVSLS